MFKKLYKTFYYETFTYIVNSSNKIVIERLDNLFMEKKGLFKSPNLSGNFVDYSNPFYMTQKWWLAHIRNFEQEPAILKGVISKLSETQTKIEIAVRPNSVFLILAVFFLPFGLYNLYKAVATKDLNATLVGLWIVVFGLPILSVFARVASRRLRTTFEKYMNMKPIDERKLPLTSVLE